MKKSYLYPATNIVFINASSSVLSIASPGDIQGNPTGGSSIGGGSSKQAPKVV